MRLASARLGEGGIMAMRLRTCVLLPTMLSVLCCSRERNADETPPSTVPTGRSTPTVSGSPSTVVSAFYRLANEGSYSAAEQYLSSATRPQLAGLPVVIDAFTHNRTISQVEILSQTESGDRAQVTFRLHFTGERPATQAVDLVREAGKWLIEGFR